MRAAIGLRLLLALTLFGWGQFGFAANYYWYRISRPDTTASSPMALCTLINSGNTNGVSFRLDSPNSGACLFHGVATSGSAIFRAGDSCPVGTTYDSATGSCIAPPKPVDCTSKPPIFSAQQCTYNEAIKKFLCPNVISYQGCEYVTAPNGSDNCDISTSICVPRYSPSGDQAGVGVPACTEGTCAPVPSAPPSDPGPAPQNCVSNGSSTYCFKDQDSGCGTFNGKEGCFQNDSGCGTFNGTWGCYPVDKEQRNCGYANGQQVCFDPKDPTKQISPNSPDHPKNGGNADGNENNDPKAPGSTGTSPQGGDQGATNEAIDQLGDDLGEKIDKTNSLLGGITGILDGIAEGLGELTDGLLGDDYDGTGDGDSGELAGMGEGAGSELGELISKQVADAEEEELAADESYLKQIAKDVDHKDFLGDDSRFGQLLQFADDLLPTHTGCVDYKVPMELGRYKADIVLPVCRIAALRPLLEYIIYIITAVGLWNIAYSTLRMENAKAAKGGF